MNGLIALEGVSRCSLKEIDISIICFLHFPENKTSVARSSPFVVDHGSPFRDFADPFYSVV